MPFLLEKGLFFLFSKDLGFAPLHSVPVRDPLARQTLDVAWLQTSMPLVDQHQRCFTGLKLLDVTSSKGVFSVGTAHNQALCFPGTSGQPHPSQFCEL